MILNSGLDNACTTAEPNSFLGSFWPFEQWISYACFGTGSAAPDPTDTALGGQVGSRITTTGGFSQTVNTGLDSGNDLIWYELTFTRSFAISSNVNATEWGLAPATTGNLSVRELFRVDPLDNTSSPITLTLEDGDELQLVITLRVQAEWEYANKSFVITGTAGNDTNGTHDGLASVVTGASTNQATITAALFGAWPAGSSSAPAHSSYLEVFLTDQSAVAKNQNTSGATGGVNGVREAYTPGAHYRDYTFTFGTGTANGTHYGYNRRASWGSGPGPSHGYRFILTSPATLTKTSTHKLTLTVRNSISRL